MARNRNSRMATTEPGSRYGCGAWEAARGNDSESDLQVGHLRRQVAGLLGLVVGLLAAAAVLGLEDVTLAPVRC